MARVASTSNVRNPKRFGYDIRLDNIYLRTAVGPNREMTIQSSDVQQGQNVNVKQNPEDFTSNLGRIYSRNNFSSGQGLDTAHRTDGKPDDVNRFWDSKGIDVFHGDDETAYNIHLLHQTAVESLSFGDSNNYLAQTTNGYLYITDGTTIHVYDGTSWDTILAATNLATHDFTGIAAFGNELYLTTKDSTSGSQLINYDGSSWSVLTTAQSSSGGLTGVWYVKNRLWVSGNDGTAEHVWEVNPFDSWSASNFANADAVIEVEPTHEITNIIDGGAVALASSTDGTVYSFKLDVANSVYVNQGQTKIPFEEVHSIASTEGIVFIGTKEVARDVGRLYRLELVNADDLYVLANRQLIKEWVLAEDTTPKTMFVSRDSVYMGIKEDSSEVNLWRYYLPTGGLARDLQTSGTGYITGITQDDGNFIIVVSGDDVYKEQSTYESEGYLVLSAADFFTAESKQFVGAEVSTVTMPENTQVSLQYSTRFEDLDAPESATFTNALTQLGGTGDEEKQIAEVSRYIIGKVILRSTDNVATPKVKSVQFRALARPELVVAQIPINISDRVERPGRKPLRVKGLGDTLYNSLRSKEGDSVTLEIFEPAEIIKGVVEQISYPIQSNDVVGSDTHYAIITVRGTRQGTIEEVTSIHTPGIASWGIMRYGA
tara:strand:- start:9122 stop:11092 length:1971 start_codon:yes stop_codon:yes gene_type:complete